MNDLLEKYPRISDPGFVMPDMAPLEPMEPELPDTPGYTRFEDAPTIHDPGFVMPKMAPISPSLRGIDPQPFLLAIQNAQDPEAEAAKIGASLHIANRLNMNPHLVYQNFDAVSEEYMGLKTTPQGFFQSLNSSYELGVWTYQRGMLGNDLRKVIRDGGDPASILNQIDKLDSQRPVEDPKGRKLPMAAVKYALEVLPPMIPIIAMSAAAVLTGGVAADVFPAYVTQIAAVSNLGRHFAAFAASFPHLKGHAMMDLYFMEDAEGNRIDPDRAVLASGHIAFLEAVVESAQVAALMPGGATTLRRAAEAVLGRIMGKTSGAAARGLLAYGIDVLGETGEEVLQDVIHLARVELEKEIANQTGASFDPATTGEIFNQLAETTRRTILASSVLLAPRAVGETAGRIAGAGRQQQVEERIEHLTEMSDVSRPAEERVADIDTRLKELDVAQRELTPKVNLENVTEIDEAMAQDIQEYRRNEFEVNYLKSLKREEEANSPGALWRKTTEELQSEPEPTARRGPAVEEVLDPDSRIRQLVREVTPQVPENQADAVAMVWAGFAHVEGMELGDWINQHFVPEMARQAELPAGKKGAAKFTERGKALLEMTATSDLSTWLHEGFHVVFEGLSEDRRFGAIEWSGATVGQDGTVEWTTEAKEKLAKGFEVYWREGRAPTPFLEELFRKIAEWMESMYHAISQRYELSEDIRTWYDTLVAQPETGAAKAAAARPTPTPLGPLVDQDLTQTGEETRVFQTEAPAKKLVGAIRHFFDTGKPPVEWGQTLFQTDPEMNPDLAEDIAAVKKGIAQFEQHIANVETGILPPGGDNYLKRLRATIEALQNVTDKGVMFSRPGEEDFDFRIIHRSTRPSELGRWRVTWFGMYGPNGHRVGGLVDLIETETMSGAEMIKTRGEQILPRERRLYQSEPEPIADPWYLRSEQTIRGKMKGPMPGRQILAMLQNAGIKQDELQWTGLEAFLDTTEKLTPQEVLDQVASETPRPTEILRTAGQDPSALPRYADWTLPGNKDHYRELLFTVPIGDQMTFAEFRRLHGWAYGQASEEQLRAEYEQVLTEETRGETPAISPIYQSPHWLEPNVLAHVRFDERIDSEGRRVLFIEEMQSDWHAEGREKGYRALVNVSELTIRERELDWVAVDADGLEWGSVGKGVIGSQEEAEIYLRRYIGEREAGAARRSIPPAPFAKTWHELALRRMARWAAEDGFDVIGWTTGRQQADRYDLSRNVELVRWKPTSPERKAVEVLLTEGNGVLDLSVASDGTVLAAEQGGHADQSLQGKHLREVLGAANAKRIIGEEAGSLSQAGLAIADTGLTILYDKILPSYAKKFGKRWKATVGETRIQGRESAAEDVSIHFNTTENPDRFSVITDAGDTVGVFDRQVDAASFVRQWNELGGEGALSDELESALFAAGKTESEIRDISNHWVTGGREWAMNVAPEAVLEYERGYEQLRAVSVHTLEITDAMRESIINEGQPLFQTDPHLDEVLDAIQGGMPVPDRVLGEYSGVPAVSQEIGRREILRDHARTTESVDEFIAWMMQAHGDRPATEAYYRMVYERSMKVVDPDPLEQDRFIQALDDRTLTDVFAEIQFIEGDNLEGDLMKALTPEMKELSKAALGEGATPEQIQAVREQIVDDPARWRRVLKEELPKDTENRTFSVVSGGIAAAEGEVDVPMDFHPLTARSANMRFTKMLDEGGLESFLADLYHGENLGARQKSKVGGQGLPVPVKIAAGQARLGGEIKVVVRKQAMDAIRRDASIFRQIWAGLYSDQEMMMQIQWEAEHRDEAEDERLRRQNTRLRDEVKKLRASGKITAPDTSSQTVNELRRTLDERQKELEEAKGAVDQAKAKMEDLETRIGEQKELDEEHPLSKALRRQIELLEDRMSRMQNLRAEEMIARAEAERAEKLRLYIFKPITTATAAEEGRAVEDIQYRIAPVPEDLDQGMESRIREWRRRNPEAALPSNLVQEIERRDTREMTMSDLEQVAEEIRALRSTGWQKRQEHLRVEREMLYGQVDVILGNWQGGGLPVEPKGLGTRAGSRKFRTGRTKKILWGTWRMNRIAEMIDEDTKYPQIMNPAGLKMLASQMMIPEETLRGMGPAYAWLHEAVNDATDRTIVQSRRVFDAQTEFLKEHKITARMLGRREVFEGQPRITHGELIGVYIYQQFDNGYFSLVNDNNISPATIAKMVSSLTPEERAYGDWMIETLSSDQDFDRLLDAQIQFHNKWMERVDRYFPFQRREVAGGEFIQEIAADLFEALGYARRARAPGFLKSRMDRIPGVAYSPLRLDAPSIFSSHVSKREFFIANAQLHKRLLRIFSSKEVGRAMTEKWGDAMPELVAKYVSASMNENIYRTHDDWAQLGRLMRTNVSTALIGYNTMTMLRNLVDIPMIMVQAGPIGAINAAAQMIRSPAKTVELLREKVPEFFVDRSYDRFTEELELLDKNAYQRTVRAVGRAGFLGLYVTDFVTNSLGGLAVYNRVMRKTGNDEVASRAARDFLLRKRPAARAKDLAQFYREPGLAPWFLIFSNQLNQQWNIVTYDIPRGIRRGFAGDTEALVDALIQVTALMVGAVGMAVVERKRIPKREEWLRDLLAWIFGNTPFIGYPIENAIRDQYFAPLFPFAGAHETALLGVKIGEGADDEATARAAMNALWGLMRGTGLPAVQARRIYRTIETGDPWALIGGPPKE